VIIFSFISQIRELITRIKDNRHKTLDSRHQSKREEEITVGIIADSCFHMNDKGGTGMTRRGETTTNSRIWNELHKEKEKGINYNFISRIRENFTKR
jgi:hypothetical protein